MMTRILSRNPLVHAFHETHFFEELWMPGKKSANVSREEAVKMIALMMSIQREGYLQQRRPQKYMDEARSLLQSYSGTLYPPQLFKLFLFYEANSHHRSIPCDQTPRNTLFLHEILEYYPEARIICMVRDPRDVLLSQKRKWKRKFLGGSTIPLRESIRAYFNYHPVTISKLWNSAARIIADANHPNVLKVKFEDILQQPEEVVKKVCGFIGISYSSQMLEVPNVGSSNAEDKGERKGVNAEKTGMYKKGLTNTEIYLAQKVTAKARENFGYRDESVKANPLMIAFYSFTLPVKLALALLFNLGHTRNLWSTIKRRL